MITPTQRANRRKHIGSSDVAALLGRSPWANVADLYLEKRGELEEHDESEPWQEAGNYIERGVLDWAEKKLGGKLTRNQYRSRPDIHLGCHIDAILDNTQEPVEGKGVGAFGDRAREFGKAGTDEVPDDVIIQCTAHMIAMTKPGEAHPAKAHVPVLFPSLTFKMFTVEWDQDLADVIEKRCKWFWDLVERGEPPPEITPHLDVLKRRKRVHQEVPLDPSLLQAWLTAKEIATNASRTLKERQREIIGAIGEADCGDAGAAGKFLYVEEAGAPRLDRERMKADGVFDTYSTATNRRVPRHQKPKRKG